MAIWNRKPRGRGTYERDSRNRMVPRWSTPPARDTAEWIQSYRTNPRLAVVTRIASDLSFAEGDLYRVGEDGAEHLIEMHPFLDFWDNPNPLHEMSSTSIWELIEVYLLLKGEGYFVIERDKLGRPCELWPVPTHWVQMTPYLGFPFYTVRLTSGSLIQISVDDMFLMKTLDPFDPYKRGMGQAQPLADEIETDEYAAKFQKKFFYNDATPNLIISMPKSSEEQRKRFRAEWMERFRGMYNSHGVATINGETHIERVGESMRDMDMVQGRKFLRDATLEHFGVPREIMGITESSNRATSEAAQFIYAQNVLMPKLRRRELAVNQQLLPAFGEDLVWRFKDIVPHNQEFDKAVAVDGWNAGLLLKNESRLKLDMDELEEGGDIFKSQYSDVYVRATDDPATVSAQATNVQYGDDSPLMDTEETVTLFGLGDWQDDGNGFKSDCNARYRKAGRLVAGQRMLSDAKREEERKFEIAVAKYFRNQNTQIAKALNGTQKAEGTIWDIFQHSVPEYTFENGVFQVLDESERIALVDKFVLGLIDWDKEADILRTIMEPLWRDSYSVGAGVAQKTYGLTGTQQPQLVSTAKLKGGRRIKDITHTTQKNIADAVSSALETGVYKKVLQEQIQEELQTSAGRAGVIAAQECNASLNAGNFDMMRKAGAATKTWHITNPGKARDTHRALNGVTVPIDAPFTTPGGVKLMMPCDPECGVASEVCGCHCFLTFDNY